MKQLIIQDLNIKNSYFTGFIFCSDLTVTEKQKLDISSEDETVDIQGDFVIQTSCNQEYCNHETCKYFIEIDGEIFAYNVDNVLKLDRINKEELCEIISQKLLY